MNYNILICLVIIFLFLMMLFRDYDIIEEFKKVSINGRTYDIQDDMENKDTALRLLNKIDNRINQFTEHLKKKHHTDKRIKRFYKMKNAKIIEPEHKIGTSSYTINKGEILAFCIRLKEDNSKFHDESILDFVIIHELAHVISNSIGHTSEWLSNFKFLLNSLSESNIYNPVDYSKKNVNYCGVIVTNNPYYN